MEGTYCFDAENPENPPADYPDVDQYGNPLIEFKIPNKRMA